MTQRLRSPLKRLVYVGLPLPRFARQVIRALYRSGVVLVEASALVRKVFWVEPVLRSVCRAMGPGLRAERLPYIRGKGDLSLGTGVYLSGRSSFFFMRGTGDAPEIVISDHTFIGSGCTFSAARSIRVGPHSLISAGVRIHDNDGHPTDAEARRRGDGICGDAMGSVVIDENVWIGAGAVVLKGVRIGRNSIVGSAAVVTRNVPPDTVVAGNPARVVKSLGEVGGTCGHGR